MRISYKMVRTLEMRIHHSGRPAIPGSKAGEGKIRRRKQKDLAGIHAKEEGRGPAASDQGCKGQKEKIRQERGREPIGSSSVQPTREIDCTLNTKPLLAKDPSASYMAHSVTAAQITCQPDRLQVRLLDAPLTVDGGPQLNIFIRTYPE